MKFTEKFAEKFAANLKLKELWQERHKLDWKVGLFLILNSTVAIAGTIWLCCTQGLSVGFCLFTLVFAGLTNLSITAGYHRLFSHKSFQAHPIAEWFFLLIGAGAFQGSALKWSSDHRTHHSHVDSEKDPYNIGEGFFYAHMGWLFMRESVDRPIKALDLQKNKRVQFQHDYYMWLAWAVGFILPTVIGACFGMPIQGFVVGGALRVFLTQQSTFFVNSLCHTLGHRTYSEEISARDSWLVAVLTHGEGYHNFHHKFQLDYRNGIRWYQWDPTKWTIYSLKLMGLASELRRISAAEILKARLQVEASYLKGKGYSQEKVEQLHVKILAAQQRMKHLHEEYQNLKKQASEATNARLAQVREELRLTQIEFKMALKQWRSSRDWASMAQAG